MPSLLSLSVGVGGIAMKMIRLIRMLDKMKKIMGNLYSSSLNCYAATSENRHSYIEQEILHPISELTVATEINASEATIHST